MRKNILLLSTFLVLFNASAGAMASTISATGLSIHEAETSLAKKAEAKGVNYKIIGAHYGNYVYLIAKTQP